MSIIERALGKLQKDASGARSDTTQPIGARQSRGGRVEQIGDATARPGRIAPPAESVDSPRRLWSEPTVSCPRCSSKQSERVSEFASTPCKALYRCTSCLEPFEYFKCI